MDIFLLVIIFLITTIIHYHYYKWRVFNTDYNLPKIYRSNVGVLIVFASKILLFYFVAVLLNWYIVLLVFIFFQILKFIAFNSALKFHSEYSYILQGRKKFGENNLSKKIIDSKLSKEEARRIFAEEKEIYKGILYKYKNKQMSGSLFSKILYLIT